jgi:hypothetical protein
VKRTCLLLLVALGAAGVAPATLAADVPPTPRALSSSAPTPPTPPTPPVVPPALQALERQMAQIRFNSLRFSTRIDLGVQDSTHSNGVSISVSAARARDTASAHHIVTSTTGVLSLSPALLSSTSTTEGAAFNEVVGGATAQERRGATTYLHNPALTRHDGGRPWIRSTRTHSEERLAAKLAPLTSAFDPVLAGAESPTASSTGPLALLLEVLGEALSIRETGAATIDAQQTLAFTATLSSTRLLDRVFSAKERRELGQGKQPPNVDFTLELWLAPSGLPVRTATTNDTHGEEFSSQEDILGLEVPVHVHAPPADRTIDEARWLKLNQRRERAVSRCLRHHPGRAKICLERETGQL